jgi:ribonuclease HI
VLFVLKNTVYFIEVYVDGCCRGNGQSGPIGAAAAVFKKKYEKRDIWTKCLPQYPLPTNQRAEIAAIILALEQILEKYEELDLQPRLKVKIYYSKYTIGCMTEWRDRWIRNGWKNSSGYEVANRDLIDHASELEATVRGLGAIQYIWIPRSENQEADSACNDAMDDMYW